MLSFVSIHSYYVHSALMIMMTTTNDVPIDTITPPTAQSANSAPGRSLSDGRRLIFISILACAVVTPKQPSFAFLRLPEACQSHSAPPLRSLLTAFTRKFDERCSVLALVL